MRIQSVEGLFKKNMSLRCARTDGNRLVSQEIVRMCLSHARPLCTMRSIPRLLYGADENYHFVVSALTVDSFAFGSAGKSSLYPSQHRDQ